MIDDYFCTCCGAKLNVSRMVWLELDQRDGKYKTVGSVPPEHSQGGFPFGKACAQRQKLNDMLAGRPNRPIELGDIGVPYFPEFDAP